MYGDRNTAYFHRVAKIKSTSKQILMLQNGDVSLTEPSAIESHAVNYF